ETAGAGQEKVEKARAAQGTVGGGHVGSHGDGAGGRLTARAVDEPGGEGGQPPVAAARFGRHGDRLARQTRRPPWVGRNGWVRDDVRLGRHNSELGQYRN